MLPRPECVTELPFGTTESSPILDFPTFPAFVSGPTMAGTKTPDSPNAPPKDPPMTYPSRRLLALAGIGSILLVGCDSGSTSPSPTSAARTCSDYSCHWAAIDSSEWTSTMEGAPLHVYDTIHLELAADSSFRDWHVEAAYAGSTRYGLKPSGITTGTWSASADSLHLVYGGTRRSFLAELTPNLLTLHLPRNDQPLVFTPR